MIYRIALKNGSLYGSGIGDEVSFKDASVSIEEFKDEESFNARLEALKATPA